MILAPVVCADRFFLSRSIGLDIEDGSPGRPNELVSEKKEMCRPRSRLFLQLVYGCARALFIRFQDCLKRQLSSASRGRNLMLKGPEFVARSIEGDSMTHLKFRIQLSGIVLFVSLSCAAFPQVGEKRGL